MTPHQLDDRLRDRLVCPLSATLYDWLDEPLYGQFCGRLGAASHLQLDRQIDRQLYDPLWERLDAQLDSQLGRSFSL